MTKANFSGYTEGKIRSDGIEHTFRAHPWFRGHPWYDWGLVEYQAKGSSSSSDTRTYPARIYGFAKMEGSDEVRATIRTSARPLSWEKVKKDFVAGFEIGTEEKSYDFVPLTSIVSPLYVFRDRGGSPTKFFAALPKRYWSEYFDERILMAENIVEDDTHVQPGHGDDSEDVSTDEENNEEDVLV